MLPCGSHAALLQPYVASCFQVAWLLHVHVYLMGMLPACSITAISGCLVIVMLPHPYHAVLFLSPCLVTISLPSCSLLRRSTCLVAVKLSHCYHDACGYRLASTLVSCWPCGFCVLLYTPLLWLGKLFLSSDIRAVLRFRKKRVSLIEKR